MDVGFGNKSQEAAIREEYRRIDEKWLKMQCQLMLFLMFFTVVAEVFMYFALRALQVEFASAGVYFAKYVLVPLVIDAGLWLGARRALHSGMSNRQKGLYRLLFDGGHGLCGVYHALGISCCVCGVHHPHAGDGDLRRSQADQRGGCGLLFGKGRLRPVYLLGPGQARACFKTRSPS